MKQIILVLVTLIPTWTFAGTADAVVERTRDEHYTYEKIPWTLTFDEGQMKILAEAKERTIDQLKALLANNPRVGLRHELLNTIQVQSTAFETGLDALVIALQKNYGTLQSTGMHLYKAIPSGVILFTGFEVTGGWILSGGGSVMLGCVIVVRKVTRTNVDTLQVDEYYEGDSNLFVWPTYNIGVGATTAGVAGTYRGGVGVIFGTLAKASDFEGLAYGASATLDAGFGVNVKGMLLKNWRKSGAVSNAFVTLGVETGVPKVEAHMNLSYIIDAASVLQTGSNIVKQIPGLGLENNKREESEILAK